MTSDWPDGFMWGTGASSTQCEGAAPASDWCDWERAGRAPISGDGNGFATRYAEDFALLRRASASPTTGCRSSGRGSSPSRGGTTRAAVDHYRAVLAAALDAGVTLVGVPAPLHAAPAGSPTTGGFLDERTAPTCGPRHVDWVAETFGDLVGGWQPINETELLRPSPPSRGGGWPPGHGPTRASRRRRRGHPPGHRRGRRAPAANTGAPVSSIFGLSRVRGAGRLGGDAAPSRADRGRALGCGIGPVPRRRAASAGREPVERPDLAGSFDLIGFSYYSAMGVTSGDGRGAPGPTRRCRRSATASGPTVWGCVLDSCLAEVHPDAPLLVAEYGIGTDDDAVARPRTSSAGSASSTTPSTRGVDVRGFFHWTGVDNYEWHHGYDVPFGLIDRDRNPKPAAEVAKAAALR